MYLMCHLFLSQYPTASLWFHFTSLHLRFRNLHFISLHFTKDIIAHQFSSLHFTYINSGLYLIHFTSLKKSSEFQPLLEIVLYEENISSCVTSVRAETEEQQETEDKERCDHRTAYAGCKRLWCLCVPLMLVYVRYMSITKKRELRSWEWQVKCDWTKRRGPPTHEHFAWSWKRQACTCMESNLLSILGRDWRCRANTMRLSSVVHDVPHQTLKDIYVERTRSCINSCQNWVRSHPPHVRMCGGYIGQPQTRERVANQKSKWTRLFTFIQAES